MTLVTAFMASSLAKTSVVFKPDKVQTGEKAAFLLLNNGFSGSLLQFHTLSLPKQLLPANTLYVFHYLNLDITLLQKLNKSSALLIRVSFGGKIFTNE